MRNAKLDEAQVKINFAGSNFNNLRYANDTTLKAENIKVILTLKSLWIVTAAMKLKDACSLEEKL